MARKPKAKRKVSRTAAKAGRKTRVRRPSAGAKRPTGRPDALDAFILAAAAALELPVAREWIPTIKANLAVTLRHAERVASFDLPDEAEPAPVFRA